MEIFGMALKKDVRNTQRRLVKWDKRMVRAVKI